MLDCGVGCVPVLARSAPVPVHSFNCLCSIFTRCGGDMFPWSISALIPASVASSEVTISIRVPICLLSVLLVGGCGVCLHLCGDFCFGNERQLADLSGPLPRVWVSSLEVSCVHRLGQCENFIHSFLRSQASLIVVDNGCKE